LTSNDRVLSRDSAPAMGDVRAMGKGQTLWILPDALGRPDWARYGDCIAAAAMRGADIRWHRG
jgi:hypothetical protein